MGMCQYGRVHVPGPQEPEARQLGQAPTSVTLSDRDSDADSESSLISWDARVPPPGHIHGQSARITEAGRRNLGPAGAKTAPPADSDHDAHVAG
jgi:hypothetical protein